MKIIYFLPVMALFFASCEKPSPVELNEGVNYLDDPVEVEVLAQNPVEELYSSDPDSMLMMGAPPDPRFGSQVIITRSKTNDGNFTREAALGEAVFYDLNSPVMNHAGRIVAFTTRSVQFVKFREAMARELPFRFRYLMNNQIIDTLLGPRFLVLRRNNITGDPFSFEYGSAVDVDIKKFGMPMQHFSVATPPEIKCEVTAGTRPDGSKTLLVKWNAGISAPVLVVLSGVAVQGSRIVPLFRIKTRDDGSLIIPPNLLAAVPPARFNKLIVSLVRQMESLNETSGEKLLFRTQSISNRVIDIN